MTQVKVVSMMYILTQIYRNEIKRTWPWEQESFKPTTDIRDLIKAGALIAAAIDRLQMKEE